MTGRHTAMGMPMTLIVIMASGLLVAAAITRLHGQVVATRFGALGDLTARTKTDVVRSVGMPSARAELAGGGEVLDWRTRGLHITLMFDASGYCVGITRCTR